MKRIGIFIFALSLRATTYYVGTTGSDANTSGQAQSASTPWLTIQHSVNNMSCGDTLIVLSNGAYLQNSNAQLPYFPNCASTTTIQGQNLAQLQPSGYRTNPAKDSANYGKLQFASTGSGLLLGTESHGGYVYGGVNYGAFCQFSGATMAPTDGSGYTTFSINTSSNCVEGAGQTIQNGQQVEFELQGQYGTGTYLALPTPIVQYKLYYVVNCSGVGGSGGNGCGPGTTSATFQVSTTSGGTPVTVTSCPAPSLWSASTTYTTGQQVTYQGMVYAATAAGGNLNQIPPNVTYWTAVGGSCALGAVTMVQALAVNVSTSTFTIPDAFVACVGSSTCFANGAPVTFNAIGIQSFAQTLPAPLQPNVGYYIVNVNRGAGTFQVSANPGGSPITLTAIGTGALSVSLAQSPSNWAFRGLEFYYTGSYTITFLEIGNATENAWLIPGSMVNHVEVDRVYMHDNPADANGAAKGIFDQGQSVWIHDSYISGSRYGEAQAINGCQALGPTLIQNNFLEAGGEITLYGGCWGNTGLASAQHTFVGNYYYKPPSWKITTNTGAASGSCWYDATDPAWVGGEWYHDTAGSQWYRCGSGGTWGAVGSGPNYNPTIKNMAEHKSGTYFTYTGNIFNYNWAQAQSGEVFNNSQEPGSGAGIANDHIIVQNNQALHDFQCVLTLEYCASTSGGVLYGYVLSQLCPTTPGQHVYRNNLVVADQNACGVLFTTGTSTCGYQMYLIQSTGPGLQSVLFDHNTIWTGDTWSGLTSNGLPPRFTFAGLSGTCTPEPASNYYVFQNSIHSADVQGDCNSRGGILAQSFTNSTFTHFATLNGTSGGYGSVGATNTWTNVAYPTLNSTVGYVNAAAGNYRLSASSIYSAANGSHTIISTDGTDLGVDQDVVDNATNAASAGTPPATASVASGSTNAVLSFSTPTAAACSTLLYPYPGPRNTNTLISTTSDTVASGPWRQTLLPTTASTAYAAAVVCGGAVVSVTNFTTRATGSASVVFPIGNSSGETWYSSASPSMSSPTSLGSGNPLNVTVSAGAVLYVSPGVSGAYPGIQILIAP